MLRTISDITGFDDVKLIKSSLSYDPPAEVYESLTNNTIIKVYYYGNGDYDDSRVNEITDITKKLSTVIPEYVPMIYTTHETKDYVMIIMEKMKGRLLGEYYRNIDLSVESRYKVATSLISAVTALHHAGYIHRDLNTSNIIINCYDDVKLIDFGESEKNPNNSGVTLSDDYIYLKSHLAHLLYYPSCYQSSINDQFKIIESYTPNNVIGYHDHPKIATIFYNLIQAIYEDEDN